MANRRDIELLISARDTSGKTFGDLVKHVNELSAALGEQAVAAARGEAPLAALEKTQRDLAAAGQELVKQQTLIDTFTRQGAAMAAAEAKAAALAAKYNALKTELAASTQVTAAQERSLASLEKQSTAAALAAEKSRLAYADTSAAIEKAGISTDRLEAQQNQLVASAKSVGTNLAAVNGILDTYEADLRQIAQAERESASTNALGQKAAQAAELRQAAGYIDFWVSALKEAEVAEQRLAALTSFRQVGQQALEASRDISRFVDVGQTVAITGRQIGAGLAAILEPGRAAIQTLDGLEAAIEEASATAFAEKKRVSEYSNALNRLSEVQAQLVRQGLAIDNFKQQAAAVDIARQKFDQAATEVEQYGRAIAKADEPNDQLTASLRRAEAVLESTGRALTLEETKLGELRRSLKGAGIDVNNLANAEKRLEAQATKTAGATAALNNSLGRNGGKPGGLFGLNPYEIQNLGFQLNDVFTQLASGAPLFQVLAQQGGQITQIFPGSISAIARFALAWSPVIIAIGAVIAVLRELFSDTNRIKDFSKALSVNVDGGLYDAATLAKTAEGLEHVGVSAEEATDAVKSFVAAGAAAEDIQKLADTAAVMAEVLGTEVPDAAEKLTSILTGGFDAVVALDAATNTLTAAELAHAKSMFDAGQAAEARQYVLDRVSSRLEDIAAKTRGPWTTTVNNFRITWDRFLGAIGRTTVFQNTQKVIAAFAASVAGLSALLAGKSLAEARQEGGAAMNAILGIQAKVVKSRNEEADQRQRQAKIDRNYLDTQGEELAQSKKLDRATQIRIARVRELRKAQNAGLSDPAANLAAERAAQLAATKFDEAQEKRNETASNKARAAKNKADAAARKAARERETEANRIKTVQDALIAQLRELDQAVGRSDNAPLIDQLDAIDEKYQKIFDTIQKLRDKGLKTDASGTPLEDVVEYIEAQKEVLKQEVRLKDAEEQLKDLTKQRKEELETISEAQERQAKTVGEAFVEAEGVAQRLTPQIIAAAKEARKIAGEIAATRPSPELMALIAELDRTIGQETTTDPRLAPQSDVGREGLEQSEKRLNDLLSDRNSLVESYNRLRELGVLTDEEARTATAEAYRISEEGIAAEIQGLTASVELMRQKGLITETVYQNWLARIRAVAAESVYVDDRVRQINQTAQQEIAQGITNAFNTAANAIGGLITGTMSFGDAISSIGRTALSFVADFTKAIADAIIQMLALQAAKSIINASSGGIGGFLFHSGTDSVGGGSGRWRRNLPAAAYLGAPRLHSGGGLGLKNDEYAAILQRGERVLTEQDQAREAAAARSAAGGGATSVRAVLAVGDEQVAQAMSGSAGEKTFLYHLERNRATVKQMIDN